jgi:hypothetical protein
MRRTDYKTMFPHLVSDPASVLTRFKYFWTRGGGGDSEKKKPATIFIASDNDGEVKSLLNQPEHRGCIFGPDGAPTARVLTWSDLEDLDASLAAVQPETLKPVISQLVLAQGKIFVGNERSSLTSLVVRLRGYAGLEKLTFYSTMGFTQEESDVVMPKPIVFLPAMNQGIAEAPWVWRLIM